uniref:Uncharacterized protein n=1 Tax=Anguilla anguilla TaxID=7936 RepID=A0A0E9W9B2_ANGAN
MEPSTCTLWTSEIIRIQWRTRRADRSCTVWPRSCQKLIKFSAREHGLLVQDYIRE